MTEDDMDLIFLSTGSGDEVANPLPDDNPTRKATRNRALRKGWIKLSRIAVEDEQEIEVFLLTDAGRARLEELGGRERLKLFFGQKPQ